MNYASGPERPGGSSCFICSILATPLVHMREIVIIRVYFFTPPLLFYSLRTCTDRTVWPIFVFYGSKDVFRWQLRPSWGANKNFNTFHYFFAKKTQNSLFPQCKISIGNNSGSIKDKVVIFAYSRGLSAIADRMVWPPSLSRDRKWPRPPIRRKTTLWMRVTSVAYKIEQSVMGAKMCFSDSYVMSGLGRKILIISTIFRKITQNSLFPQCKTSIGNNSGSIEDLRISWGYRPLRIEWCDRYLCHVTGSDHAHRFGVKQHFECV